MEDWIDEGGIVVRGIDISQLVGTGDTFVSLGRQHSGGEARVVPRSILCSLVAF